MLIASATSGLRWTLAQLLSQSPSSRNSRFGRQTSSVAQSRSASRANSPSTAARLSAESSNELSESSGSGAAAGAASPPPQQPAPHSHGLLSNPIDLMYHVEPFMIIALLPLCLAFEGVPVHAASPILSSALQIMRFGALMPTVHNACVKLQLSLVLLCSQASTWLSRTRCSAQRTRRASRSPSGCSRSARCSPLRSSSSNSSSSRACLRSHSPSPASAKCALSFALAAAQKSQHSIYTRSHLRLLCAVGADSAPDGRLLPRRPAHRYQYDRAAALLRRHRAPRVYEDDEKRQLRPRITSEAPAAAVKEAAQCRTEAAGGFHMSCCLLSITLHLT